MKNLNWDPNLETGIAQIDHQHRILFKHAASLLQAVHAERAEDQITGMVKFLNLHVNSHFACEELAMALSSYRDLDNHRLMHRDLSYKVGFINICFTDEGYDTTKTMVTYFIKWLTRHIDTEDRRMADHLKTWIENNPGVSLDTIFSCFDV